MVFIVTALLTLHLNSIYTLELCWKQNKEHGSGVLCNYLKTPAFFPDNVSDNA